MRGSFHGLARSGIDTWYESTAKGKKHQDDIQSKC